MQHRGQNRNQPNPKIQELVDKLKKNKWISEEFNKAAIDYCEEVGKFVARERLTTSQFRNFFSEIRRIQFSELGNQHQGGTVANSPSFLMLRPKLAYAYAKDAKSKKDLEKISDGFSLFKEIMDEALKQVTDDKQYMNFVYLMEAILAYHKAHGGESK